MTNPDQQPWAPDPDVPIGNPSERGTSAFDGNADYLADGSPKNPVLPKRGPALGIVYHEAQWPTGVASAPAGQRNKRSTAGTTNKRTPAVTLTASATSVAAGASVTFTAQFSSPEDYVISGTVTFLEGATTLGTATLDANERAVYTHAAGFAIGPHTVVATYPGNDNFVAVTSGPVTVTAA